MACLTASIFSSVTSPVSTYLAFSAKRQVRGKLTIYPEGVETRAISDMVAFEGLRVFEVGCCDGPDGRREPYRLSDGNEGPVMPALDSIHHSACSSRIVWLAFPGAGDDLVLGGSLNRELCWCLHVLFES